MPTPLLKKLAKDSGLSLKEVETKWAEAKNKITNKKAPYYWGEVVSLTKKLIGLNESVEENAFEELLSYLLFARNVAHAQHWLTHSFAQHMALNELYDLLSDRTDELAEMYMGIYELSKVEFGDQHFDTRTPLDFVEDVLRGLDEFKSKIPQDGFLINKFEELQGEISQIAYKLRKLS